VYSNGENGSPMIALKSALAHQSRITANVLFLFIEKEEDRAKNVRSRKLYPPVSRL
jgi:hypothetical protein